MTVIESGVNGIPKVAETILQMRKNEEIIFLNGKVGSGKTALVSAALKVLGIKEPASSPTFSIQNVYEGSVFHYDMYNKSFEELASLGLLDSFDNTGLHIVEWGDEKLKNTLEAYGHAIIDVSIEEKDQNRIYRISHA